MSVATAGGVPAVLPESPRRAVVYTVWDRRGGVEDFVLYALAGLRQSADLVMVVVNGGLDAAARRRLEEVSDDILVRPNTGYDIWGHRAALEALGSRIDEYDEIVFTNDTWFGPVNPFEPVFARMADRAVDFWGMTDHAREEPNPFTGEGVLHYHLQSFWIAVRRRMFSSDRWREYWRDLPEMPDYFDAVLKHETVFTEHFATAGFVHGVAFPAAQYPTDHPALFNADLLLADGCPMIKRRPFFHYPPFLDRHAVIGRDLAEQMSRAGYPMPVMWRNLARNVEPKILNADAGMLEVLDRHGAAYDPDRPLRTAVIIHIHYPEMTAGLLRLASNLPGPTRIVVTTSDDDRRRRILEAAAAVPDAPDVEVRVVDSNDGRDQSAFYIGCRDILRSDDVDLVVKLHSKKTPQDGFNIGRHFARQQSENLLAGPGHAASLVALFQAEPGLGLAFAPMIHIGYPTMGRAWWANKPGTQALCDRLGIRVPLDDVSPLAPLGSMFAARPEALRLLVDQPWTYGDFGGPGAYADGGLAHVLERMPCYAAGELGYHTRTVATADYMAISHTALEYKLDQISATLPGDSVDAIHYLRGVGQVGEGRIIDFARMYLRLHRPGTGAALRRVAGAGTPVGRLLRRIARRGR